MVAGARVLGFGLRPGPWEVTMTTRPIAGDRELVPVAEPLVSDGERAALAGFLAGCSGLTPSRLWMARFKVSV